ncbi:MAG: TonB family protein [Luteitalea sp.]|nr:TonB family protein [Luteitalea sp.]
MKITAIMLLALTAAALLRRQPAALRHWILACAVACAAATPILSLLVPAWPLGLAPVAAIATTDVSGARRNAANPRAAESSRPAEAAPPAMIPRETGGGTRPLSWWLAAVWIAGASIGLGAIFVGFLRLAWLASRARRITSGQWRDTADRISEELRLPRPVALLHSEHPTLLVTWGTLRPKIILPATAVTWPLDRIGIVLRHELAHVQRRDWAVQVAAELLKSIYWFNPVLWIAGRRLRLESEHACDDAVVNSGIGAADYATHLLELARTLNQQPRTWMPAPAIARPSSLHRRVSAMLNARLNRQPIPRSLRAAVALALLATTVAIAAAQAPFATVSGTVLDSSGGFIPGATLTISNTQNRTRHEVKTDATGRFEFVGLPGGEYSFEATYVGFAISRETLTLSPGQLMSKNVALQLGSLQETITVRDSDSPPVAAARRAAAPVSPPPCVAGTVGGNIKVPKKLVDVKPNYPSNLRTSRATGQVEMEATIGPDGSVREVQVISSPYPDMTTAATDAVRQWRFSPTLLNCAAVDVNMHVSVSFLPLQ